MSYSPPQLDYAPKPPCFRRKCVRRWIVIGTIFLAAVLAWWCIRRLNPPLTFDTHGFPHGSGTKVYRYPSGAIKLKDRYVNGIGVESTWFRPDGSILATTTWIDGTGVGFYLRDDGSVRVKMQYQKGLANGPATYFAEDGSIMRVAMFRNGHEVTNDGPTTHQ